MSSKTDLAGVPGTRGAPATPAPDSSRRQKKPKKKDKEAKAQKGTQSDTRQRSSKLPGQAYRAEILRLQEELVKMGEWVRETGARVVVIFEGRDAAGKGGTIKRATEFLNPRVARIVALPIPTEREKAQWYFQRYVEHLPAAGEIVIFDRSWYNRAGVEKVLGFCTDEEHRRFLRQCPVFERMLLEDGIHLVKYWFSVSDAEQARRFEQRIHDPMKRWKLSPTDLLSRTRWMDYSRAKDEMFVHTDTPEAPWWIVEADDKRSARINCIAHLLTQIPYQAKSLPDLKIPKRQRDDGYERPPRDLRRYVPDRASSIT
jgi:polyphosphate kinase 2